MEAMPERKATAGEFSPRPRRLKIGWIPLQIYTSYKRQRPALKGQGKQKITLSFFIYYAIVLSGQKAAPDTAV